MSIMDDLAQNGTAVVRGIDPADLAPVTDEAENAVLALQPKTNRIESRTVCIASCDKPGDNRITEYLNDDRLVASVYAKRNDYNTVDLYISIYQSII